jgi:hypothetical protein
VPGVPNTTAGTEGIIATTEHPMWMPHRTGRVVERIAMWLSGCHHFQFRLQHTA